VARARSCRRIASLLAVVALILFAAWLYIVLPLIYLPNDGTHEFLGVKYGEWLMFVATVALVIATVALVIAAWMLVRGADRNAERQLRAYVTVRDINLVPRRKGGTPSATGTIIDGPVHTYELAAILRNSGQTPAINATINVSCSEQHIPLAVEFDFPNSDIVGHGLIGPGGEIFSPPIFVSAQQLETEKAGRTWFFWGWVEYDDIFHSRHRTEFCFRINRRRLEWTNEFVMAFTPDASFNNMDQGCLRRAQ
jgi:hypothetical protein